MAFFNALSNLNVAKTLEDAFGAPDITSAEMRSSIILWRNLYYNSPIKHDCEIDPAQRIPYVVVDGLYKAVFGEYEYTKDESNPSIANAIDALNRRKKEAFQHTLMCGEGFLKPIPYRDSFAFSFIARDSYLVFERDVEGNITSVGTSDKFTEGKYFYTLCEKRYVDESGRLTIESVLYRSEDRSILGSIVPLDSVGRYADLQPTITFNVPVWSLGLIPIKTPMVNCVDGSDDGVSVYAAATAEILNSYRHAQRTANEYELTEPHMAVSADVYKKDEDGNMVGVPKYVHAINDEPENVGAAIYNPTPHQTELEARENQQLRHIEDICGLRRGIISHVDSEDKTATEVITSSGRYALTVKDFQSMWDEAYQEALRLTGILGSIYYKWPSTPPESTITWGNGVLYDEDKEFSRMQYAVSGGYLKEEYLPAWLYDEPLETEEDFAHVREKYMPPKPEGIFGQKEYGSGEDDA